MEPTVPEPLLAVENLTRYYPVPRGLIGTLTNAPRHTVRAVDGVNFTLDRGEALALVGESGCGKTTTALTVLGLVEPTSGSVQFEGRPWHAELRRDRSLRRAAQMIFQDPYESLSPRMKVGELVAEPLLIHRIGTVEERRIRAYAALEEVGLSPAAAYVDRFPHELSGGQRQRVVIAAALVCEPLLLVADEPVSMLDVSIRAEILALLGDLRQRRGIGILFITHDLATAALFADRIAVMYLGRIVEIGPAAPLIAEPQHPYTRALLNAVPSVDPRRRRSTTLLQGETPNPAAVPPGCRFHPRCPLADAGCARTDPQLERKAGRQVACLKV
jgi:oligopeptide/dipeptide ABC transporter ATP-binding protein